MLQSCAKGCLLKACLFFFLSGFPGWPPVLLGLGRRQLGFPEDSNKPMARREPSTGQSEVSQMVASMLESAFPRSRELHPLKESWDAIRHGMAHWMTMFSFSLQTWSVVGWLFFHVLVGCLLACLVGWLVG